MRDSPMADDGDDGDAKNGRSPITPKDQSTDQVILMAKCCPKTSFRVLVISFIVLLSTNQYSLAMKLVVQRVKSASVTVDNQIISSIGPGVMALVGLHEHDTEKDLNYCCKRLLACKLFANDDGALWRHGVKQRELEVLCVSQFTLYGKLTKKNQPDYKSSMKSVPAQALYSQFLELLKEAYEPEKIKDGEFGAMMDVALVNDGPVTVVFESEPKAPLEDGHSSKETEALVNIKSQK
jgi:D-tyrosyl-tRNA(Tyr) deacylase